MSDRYVGYGLVVGVFIGSAVENMMAGIAGGLIIGILVQMVDGHLRKTKKGNSITQRLQELENIKSKGIIDEADYTKKNMERIESVKKLNLRSLFIQIIDLHINI